MAAEIKRLFEGKWKEDRSDNWGEYLDKMGVGMIKKKLASVLSPTLTVNVERETIEMAMSAGPITNKASFQLGVQFETNGDIVGDISVIANFSDGLWTMVMTPKDPKKGTQTITREITNGELIQTMELEGVVCKRYFKRV